MALLDFLKLKVNEVLPEKKILAPKPLSLDQINPMKSPVPMTPYKPPMSVPKPTSPTLDFVKKSISAVIPNIKALPKQVAGLFPGKDSELKTGIQQGTLGVSAQIDRFNQAFYKTFGDKGLSEFSRKNAEADEELLDNWKQQGMVVNDQRKLSEKLKDPKWFYSNLGQGIPSVLGSLGVAIPVSIVAGPVAGIAAGTTFGFGQNFGAAYKDAKDHGVPDDQAQKIATSVGVGNAFLEALPAMRIITKTFGSSVAKPIRQTFLKNVYERARSILAQGATESSTESLQTVYENAWAQTYDENRNLFTGVPESAIFGGILGSGTDVATQGVQAGIEFGEKGKELYQQMTPEQKQAGFAKLPGGEEPQDLFGFLQKPVQQAIDENKKPEESTDISLPKEVSIHEEAKLVGSKRISPDRIPHQQLTPEEGIKALVSKAQKKADSNSDSWIKASDVIQELINKYGSKLPSRTSENIKKYPDLMNDFSKFNSYKKYANSSTLSGMRDEFLQKSERVKWNEEKEEAYNTIVADEYKDLVKKDISKGYKFPEDVLDYDKSFRTAVDNRARYEKGLHTSFSADDTRIVFDEQGRIVAGMKRQDGKALLPEQKQEIIDGVLQTQRALGIDLNKISKDERWVYAHLNGKNPFLTKNAAGLYRKDTDSVSVSLGGTESFDAIIDGEKVIQKVNTTIAHEIGHALDFNQQNKLLDWDTFFDLKKTFKPVTHGARGDKYWKSKNEVTARAIEQYVAVKEGHTEIFDREGYWPKAVFESRIKPVIEKNIDTFFSQYKVAPSAPTVEPKASKKPEAISSDVEPLAEETKKIPPEISPDIEKPEVKISAPEVPAGSDVNLIKTISEEKMPGPIADLLESQYKNISRRTLDFFAKRLSKLKGTKDITGFLNTLARMNRSIKNDAAIQTYKTVEEWPIQTKDLDRQKEGSATSPATGAHLEVLPPTLGELLSKRETSSYFELLTRNLKDPETAVLASQEYDKMWQAVNGRAVIKYEELAIEKEILEEAQSQNNAKELIKYFAGKKVGDYSLNELFRSAQGTQRKARRLDEIVTGLDFQDIDHAQQRLDEYISVRESLKHIKDEMRRLAPDVKASKLFHEILNEMPVVSDKGVLASVNDLANPEDIRNVYKDISGFKKEAMDPPRIFEDFFRSRYPQFKETIQDPFDASKGDMVDEINKLGTELEEGVTKKFKINRGSKDAQRIRMYGEGKLNAQQLVNDVGEARAREIVAADAWFKDWYGRLLKEANTVLAEIYPNNPEKLIPEHSNYYRHLRDESALNDTLSAIKNMFDTPAGIDPELAGLSEFTKPRMKFLSFAKRRLGETTDTDAIEGALDYIASFSYLKHISPNIGKFRYLRRRLAEASPTPGDPMEFGKGQEKGINNFLVFLDNFANNLAGKSHPLDRWISDTIPGGRRAMRIINMANSRVKANTVLANAASALAQLANIPAGLASAKIYSLHGARKTLASIFMKNPDIAKSNFMKERTMKSLGERFKQSWADHPVKRGSSEAKSMAVWLMRTMDGIGSHFIWNSHYEKALAQGIDNPTKYADDMTRKLVAGRGIGEVPLGQQAKIFQLISPFTVEVGTLWWIMRDFVKKKDFAALVILAIASWLFNEFSERAKGNRVVFDPINSLMEGSSMLAGEDDKLRGATKFLGRQAGEVLSNVPLGQTIAGQIPDSTVEAITNFLTAGKGKMDKQELFGQGNPGRFGSGFLVWKAIQDPIFGFLLPFGGNQFKKTKEGIEAYLSGEVRSKDDKLNVTVEKTVGNLIKAILFGKNATDEANKFFDEREHLFQLLDKQTASREQTAIDAENKWAEIKKIGKEQGKVEAEKTLKEISKTNPVLAKKIVDVIKAERAGLDGTDRLIKMLGVENGERAKYIYETMQDFKTAKEKTTYLQELKEKKLLSAKVYAQLLELKKKPAIKSNFARAVAEGAEVEDTSFNYYYENMIKPTREVNEFGLPRSEIKQLPKKTVAGFVRDILNKIPFGESQEGKALKQEAFNVYQFTDQMERQLATQTKVRSSAPEEVLPGLVKEDNTLAIKNPWDVRFGGEHHRKRLYDLVPNLRDWVERGIFNGEIENLSPTTIGLLFSEIPGAKQIQLKELSFLNTAHELLHSAYEIKEIDPYDFNIAWQKALDNKSFPQHKMLKTIDGMLGTDSLYAGIPDEMVADERFAYFGAAVGVGGLESIPDELKPFYEDIFK